MRAPSLHPRSNPSAIPLSRLSPEAIAEVQKAAPAKAGGKQEKSPAKKPAIAKPTKPEDIEIKVVDKGGERTNAEELVFFDFKFTDEKPPK